MNKLKEVLADMKVLHKYGSNAIHFEYVEQDDLGGLVVGLVEAGFIIEVRPTLDDFGGTYQNSGIISIDQRLTIKK